MPALYDAYRLTGGATDYAAIARAAVDPATVPVEVSEAEYYDALECLPPLYVRWGFMVGEAVTGSHKGTVYAHYAQRGDRYFARFAVVEDPETYIPEKL